MDEWTKIHTPFATEEKAIIAANIVATTESRLASQRGGPQYDVETRLEQTEGHWYVCWRKVLIPSKGGCGAGCGSCENNVQKPMPVKAGKVLLFKRKAD